MKKIAVVLCGSGFEDGSEIRESVGVLWALSEAGADVQCFAPDAPQADVVNCLTLQPAAGETRNQLVEAARIARGKVKPLAELRAAEFDGIVIPGGFGAAKNLCTFATQGSGGSVRPELAQALKDFAAAKKPIGAVCIAPAILALTFRGQGIEITLGDPSEASAEAEKLGARHVAKPSSEWHVDQSHRIVTTPAYMHDDAPLHEIFRGIRGCVQAVLGMA